MSDQAPGPEFDTDKTFGTMSDSLVKPITESMDVIISNFSSNLGKPATIMATILIIFYGIKLIYGKVDATGFVITISRIAVVTLLVTNASEFNYYVKKVFFEHLPEGISNAIISKEPVQANVFDEIMGQAVGKTEQLKEQLGWTDFGGEIACLFILFAIAVFCTVGFVVQSIAQVGLALVIALGPLFICLYMWDSTKRFTEAWIAQAANFVILQILVVALAVILSDMYTNLMKADWESAVEMIAPVLAITVVSVIILILLPSIASALAGGGAALTGMGMAANVTNAARKGLGKIGNAASRARNRRLGR